MIPVHWTIGHPLHLSVWHTVHSLALLVVLVRFLLYVFCVMIIIDSALGGTRGWR